MEKLVYYDRTLGLRLYIMPWGLVGGTRFELVTSSVSTKRSSPELTAPNR